MSRQRECFDRPRGYGDDSIWFAQLARGGECLIDRALLRARIRSVFCGEAERLAPKPRILDRSRKFQGPGRICLHENGDTIPLLCPRVHLADGASANPSDRRAVNTSGTVTNGTCAAICTHQRNPNAGALPVAAGITTSDITSQMRGPYTAATASAPPNRVTVRRNANDRVRARMNAADQTNATKKCSASPAARPRAPISNMRGPNGTDATPCQNRLNVEPYARMPSRLAHTKSQAAVMSHVATIAAAMLLSFTVLISETPSGS